MHKSLTDRIWCALKDRTTWEERQRVFYAMRRDGLRRRKKPYPGAADLHLPIADNAVSKLKPYDINGVFGRQVLASFTALRSQQAEASARAAQFLDWNLRNRSNFARAYARAVDRKYVAGRAILKVRWDADAGGVTFDVVDPLYFVVPTKGSDDIDEMDWFCHIKVLSVGQYRRARQYVQDEQLLGRIRGGDRQEEFTKEREKEHREGLTFSNDEDTIVLWEAYERVPQGWRVSTCSPCAPDHPVRQPFLLNYRWQDKPWQPFVCLVDEITDEGWYAPRGVVEKVAPFETYGTKLWNAKADWLDYANKPLFTQEVGAAAATNRQSVTLAPGEVLPPGMAPAQIPEPPFALDGEINACRQLAEESAGSPDFGVAAEGGGGKDEKRTATEWNYIGSFANQGIQHRAWIASLSEGEIYWRAWALYVQFGGEELAYWDSGERKVLAAQARHDQYLIAPDTQPDQWNKQQRMARAVARKQMFTGNPNIDQVELDRSVLEVDDPRLVNKLVIGQSVKAGEEAEDEAKELTIMIQGFPATVSPGEDHALRIKVLAGWLQFQGMRGIAVDPVARQRVQEHLAQHVRFLQEQNPQAARQFLGAVAALDADGGMGGPMGGPMGGELGGAPMALGEPGAMPAAPAMAGGAV